MAFETDKTQKHQAKNYPHPSDLKTQEDIKKYLMRLYTALQEDKVKGFAGEIFVGTEDPPSHLGKNGDIYIQR